MDDYQRIKFCLFEFTTVVVVVTTRPRPRDGSTKEIQQRAGEPGNDGGLFHTTQRVGTPSQHRRPPLMGSHQ